jgi:hypothetical protein
MQPLAGELAVSTRETVTSLYTQNFITDYKFIDIVCEKLL